MELPFFNLKVFYSRDMGQPSGGEENMFLFDRSQQDKTTNSTFESSASSTSEAMSEVIEQENSDNMIENIVTTRKSVYAMTDMSLINGFISNPFQSELQDFFKYVCLAKPLISQICY